MGSQHAFPLVNRWLAWSRSNRSIDTRSTKSGDSSRSMSISISGFKQHYLEKFLADHGFRSVYATQRAEGSDEELHPLHVAVQQCDAAIVKMLLEAGAPPEQRDVRGRTPMDLAEELNQNRSHVEILLLLSDASAMRRVAF